MYAKKKFCFSPGPWGTVIIIPTMKTVGNAKAITVMKDFAGHMSLDLRNSQTLRQFAGNMTNNQFSSLHAHSETVTVLEG